MGVKNVESAANVEFVGRDEEQSQMMDAWNMVALSSGQAVVLTGDAGVRKSALTMHVIGEIAEGEAKPLVMLCRSASHRKDTPMYTGAQMLKRWSSDGLGERAQVRRILKDAGLDDQARAHASPLLLLLGVKNEETSKMTQDDVRATLLALLVSLSSFRPIVIVVEDGEHIDAASLLVLDELVKTKLRECKILVLMGVRAKGLSTGSCLVDWVNEQQEHAPLPRGTVLARRVGVDDGASVGGRVAAGCGGGLRVLARRGQPAVHGGAVRAGQVNVPEAVGGRVVVRGEWRPRVAAAADVAARRDPGADGRAGEGGPGAGAGLATVTAIPFVGDGGRG